MAKVGQPKIRAGDKAIRSGFVYFASEKIIFNVVSSGAGTPSHIGSE
jgi:hypothetical protein